MRRALIGCNPVRHPAPQGAFKQGVMMAVTNRADRNTIREATEELKKLTEQNEELKKKLRETQIENAYLKGQGGVR